MNDLQHVRRRGTKTGIEGVGISKGWRDIDGAGEGCWPVNNG